MTATEPSSGRTWRYRFTRPDEGEIEICELNGDDTAEAHAEELSKAHDTPVKFFRHDLVDWKYMGEVDETR